MLLQLCVNRSGQQVGEASGKRKRLCEEGCLCFRKPPPLSKQNSHGRRKEDRDVVDSVGWWIFGSYTDPVEGEDFPDTGLVPDAAARSETSVTSVTSENPHRRRNRRKRLMMFFTFLHHTTDPAAAAALPQTAAAAFCNRYTTESYIINNSENYRRLLAP